MDIKVIVVCFVAALFAGLIHGAIGLGFGMLAMAITTIFLPYNNAAAIVSVALLVVVFQVSISLRQYIDWRGIIGPSIALTVGKALGIVLMMQLMAINSNILRISLGVFLIVYSLSQILNLKAFQIKGTPLQGILFCGLGGFFGGMYNVSGPAASIYCQAKYGSNPKEYAANMNAIFSPSAIVALIMHILYGNFGPGTIEGSASITVGSILAIIAGLKILNKLNAKKLRLYTYIFIIIMGFLICISK